jgi:hypothetical protein
LERVSNPALNWLRQVCLASETDARLDEELTASGILEICQGHSLDIPGVANDAQDEKAALLRIGCIMKKTFKEKESIGLATRGGGILFQAHPVPGPWRVRRHDRACDLSHLFPDTIA